MNAATALSLARQQHQAGDLGRAEALYRQALEAEPESAEALCLLGMVCQTQGRAAESIALYRRCLEIKPDCAEALSRLGAAYASQDQLDEAIACGREAVRLRPDYAEAFNNLGHSFAARGHLNEAVACYEQAARLNPGGPRPASEPETAESLNNQGVALMGQGRLDEALAHWRRSLSLKETAEVHNNVGFLHASRGEWDQAVASYRQALALKPHYPEALCNLGVAHVQQQRLDEAVRCFHEALALRPDLAEVLNNLGNVLLFQGNPAEAADCYRRALRLRPDDARTHGRLGNALQLQGKDAEALDCYRQLLALSPDDAEVRFLVEALSGPAPPTQAPASFVAALYDRYADSFDKDLVERLGYRGPEMLKAALGPAPTPRSLAVLDLGCGTGLCGAQFRDWARSLTGVDLSPNMLARARERGVYDELIPGDLLAAVQDAEARYDLVLAGDVFIYVGDLGPLFRHVRRALRPGGRFAFTVELLEGADYRLLPTLRFAHSRAYLQSLAAATELQEVCVNPVMLRRESGQEVAGLVVVLSR